MGLVLILWALVGRGERITKRHELWNSLKNPTCNMNQQNIVSNELALWKTQQYTVSSCFYLSFDLHTQTAPYPTSQFCSPWALLWRFANSLCMDNIIIQETGLFYYPWFYHYVILTTWPTCCVYGLANRKTQKQQGWLGSLRHDMVQRQGCLQWFLRVRRLKFISLLNEMFGNFRFPAISVWQHAWRFKIFISLNQSVHQINQIPDKLLLLRGCPTNWTSREATNPFCPLWCK